mmetsp:Transcript_3509/g.5301  ORF Transcript_3509/g.5301 Transcript_3509/m.5301 type:complete len:83 (-) Transcript_3509:375-623(-)
MFPATVSIDKSHNASISHRSISTHHELESSLTSTHFDTRVAGMAFAGVLDPALFNAKILEASAKVVEKDVGYYYLERQVGHV